MPKSQNTQRFDRISLPGPGTETPKFDTYMVQPLKKTDEGFLQGRAIATNIGVFPYTQADGTVRRELRLPEEVRNYDSLNSLKMKPITNDHPQGGLVNTSNVRDLSVGQLGDDVRADSFHVSVPISITDPKAIADVQSGKVALSCGYTCDLEHTPGNWMGVNYDAIQRNIRYNHLAIVKAGRAGDAAKMHTDSAIEGGICIHTDETLEAMHGKAIVTETHIDDSHERVVVDSGVSISTIALGLRSDFNPNHGAGGKFASTGGGSSHASALQEMGAGQGKVKTTTSGTRTQHHLVHTSGKTLAILEEGMDAFVKPTLTITGNGRALLPPATQAKMRAKFPLD